MRIAWVVTGGLHPSGREQVMPALLWLIARLARANQVHAFVVRHLSEQVTYPLEGATVHDLGRPTGRWSQWKALRAALAAHGPFDLIHGYWVDPAGLLAAIAGRRFGVPGIVTCDSGEFAALPEIGYGLQRTSKGRATVALACRLATRVHVTTRFMEGLATSLHYDTVRIPFGVDRQRVASPGDRPDGPPWRLLQVASLNPVKDQATLLRAIAIARQSLDVRLDLVGEDTLGGALQREAATLDLGDAVAFHGFVSHDQLAAFHHHAHLYVQSSRHEAAGMAVLEAAAAGIPIVGTRVGFVGDWDSHAATAVGPNDPDALAAAIVQLLRDPSRREKLAKAAHDFASHHDADWSAEAVLSLYDSLIAARAPSR